MLDTLTEVSKLLCGRPNALKIEDEFNIGEVDNVDNTDDIEQAVDSVVNTLNKEADRLRNGTSENVGTGEKTSDATETSSSAKTQTETEKSEEPGSSGSSQPETMFWSAYQLREIMEFKSK